MSLSDPVGAIVAAVVGSSISGVAGFLFWQNRSPRAQRRVKDALEPQAQLLQGKLEQQYEAHVTDLKRSGGVITKIPRLNS